MKPIISKLKWTFTPDDFFGEDITIDYENFSIEITNGNIVANIIAETETEEYFLEIEEVVRNAFRIIQLVSNVKYNISKYSLYKVDSTGKEIQVISVVINLSSMVSVDWTGAAEERIKTKQALFNKAIKFRNDLTLISIIKSYTQALAKKDNFFIYLYEVRDCLSKRFGSESNTRKSLNISKEEWKRLGQICNALPLKEGRHRGMNFNGLRNATNKEILEAQKITNSMIIAYIHHLENELLKSSE